MKIIHTFIKCLHCMKELEVTDEDFERGDLDCHICGYLNEFTDQRIAFYEDEY